MPEEALNLIRASRIVFPERSLRSLRLRFRFIRAGLSDRKLIRQLLNPPQGSSLASLMRERPETVGVLIWPFQCASWPKRTRVERLLNHFDVVDSLDAPFPFSIHEKVVLLDLDRLYPSLRVVLDQPRWFMREGPLVINLFVDRFRAYSLAFALHRDQDGSISMVVGCIQGRDTHDALSLYRDLTKSLHGMRPRDFLLETLKMLGRPFSAEKLLCVCDEQRHHRHPYFGKEDLPGDYNSIWQDRGGERTGDGFYSVPLCSERKDPDQIKSKKKSLYKKRYEMLDELENTIRRSLPMISPERFIDL